MIWNTEEVLELIEWLRAYNRTAPAARKVRFYGFDIQEAKQAGTLLRDYLKRVAPELEPQARVLIDASSAIQPGGGEASHTEATRLQVQLKELIAQLVLDEPRLVTRARWRDYADAQQYLRLLVHYLDNISGKSRLARDRYMADSSRYILQRQGPEARMVLWAHNLHLIGGKTSGDEPYAARMGSHLQETFGRQYYSFGFVFGSGSFLAYDASSDRFRDFASGSPPEGSLDWQLAQARLGDFIIDLRRESPDPSVRQWLRTNQTSRQAGYLGRDDLAQLWGAGKQLATFKPIQFDAVIYIGNTTGARFISRKL